MTRLCTLADAEAVAVRGAREIAAHIERARRERGVAHLALSGGSTPERTYELLADALQDWERVEIWFADERCVAAEDEQSNYRMARERLLERIALDPARIHRMEGELGPEEGAKRYARMLAQRVRPAEASDPPYRPAAPAPRIGSDTASLPALDAIVLGIGPDGHVASLFPDAPTLGASPDAVCLPVHDSPKPPPQRITLSLALLRAARRCILLATTAEKRTAIAGALAEPSPHVPASLLERARLTVIVDDAATPPAPGSP
jgi:6-phosphogluconolactonase